TSSKRDWSSDVCSSDLTCGKVLRDQPGEDDVGGPAEDPRPHHAEGHRDDAHRDGEDQEGAFGPHLAHQALGGGPEVLRALAGAQSARGVLLRGDLGGGDRKSTRLNSSHVSISYAV